MVLCCAANNAGAESLALSAVRPSAGNRNSYLLKETYSLEIYTKKNVHTNLGIKTSNPIILYKMCYLLAMNELLLDTIFCVCDVSQPLSYGSDEYYFG